MKYPRCWKVAICVFLAVVALTIGGALIGWQVSSGGSSVSFSKYLEEIFNPSDVPSSAVPPTTPSFMPSSNPSDVPSEIPSLRPSLSPSQRPSAAPSSQPSANPSVAPSMMPTLGPTRAPISRNYAFQLKLFWNNYYWQEEDWDREWCLECASCKKTSVDLDTGEDCVSSGGSGSKFVCTPGDQLWVQKCGKNRGNAVFNLIQGEDDADQIGVEGTDLCLERHNARRILLKTCDTGELRQQWVGFTTNRPFELRPVQHLDRCITQHHHPKENELIYTETCHLAHNYDTGFWEAF